MFGPREEAQIRGWNQALDRKIHLELVLTGDDRSKPLLQYCEHLARIAPRIEIKKTRSEKTPLPGIRVLPNLIFCAAPGEQELGPFLEAAGNPNEDSTTLRRALSGMTLPADLSLFVSPQCPHCPEMVRRLTSLAFASEKIRLSIIDAGWFAEAAQSSGIRSVPTLVLDSGFRWTGVVPIEDLLAVLVSRNPADLSESSLASLIEEGNARQVIDLLRTHRVVFPALIELLADEKWPRRLGAMVVLETLAEEEPGLAACFIPPLLERLAKAGEIVKGDIIYILGEIAGPDLLPHLEEILNGNPSVDVKESVVEAMEKIRAK